MPFFEVPLYRDSKIMDEPDQYITSLLEQFHKGTISEQGMQELMAWYDTFENDPSYRDGLTDDLQRKMKQNQFATIKEELDGQLKDTPDHASKLRLSIWPRIMVAASFLMVMSVGWYLFSYHRLPAIETTSLEDFQAGSNKAELTLANGEKIRLDDAANGKLAIQGNTVIRKTADGNVIYGNEGDDEAVFTNTMRTPRGGQYHLILADGTGVWLNAASSITYPSSFAGDVREVKTTGEIYFEVAHNAAKPFRVKSSNQTVEVLGTHFNINAYENEGGVSTTLLEGSVRVVAGAAKCVIKPGQQARFNDSQINVQEADLDEVMAWKDGYFEFTDTSIQLVMKQISRWYDVDVEFQGPVTKETFTGKIPKTFNLAKTIEVMQMSKSVKITVQGRRIMVR